MCYYDCIRAVNLNLGEEIFVLINSRNKKRFPKKCSQCISQRRLAQKVCIMEEKNPNTMMNSCLVWYMNQYTYQCILIHGPSHHAICTREEWYVVPPRKDEVS